MTTVNNCLTKLDPTKLCTSPRCTLAHCCRIERGLLLLFQEIDEIDLSSLEMDCTDDEELIVEYDEADVSCSLEPQEEEEMTMEDEEEASMKLALAMQVNRASLIQPCCHLLAQIRTASLAVMRSILV